MSQRAFTLTELLVVILIIGVLTAIALPRYQTAVDESRYATLMPMAKSVASAQEAYYLNDGRYSEDLAYLDVQLPNNPSGTVANIGDGLKIEISEDTDYGYVKMSKEGLENNYIIYQDNSLNYPKEIHCEALSGSERAERLCKSLGGEYISGSLSVGYDTYVLEGGGSGIPWSLAHAGPAGWQSCDEYPCTKACDREVKAGYTCTGTYNEDHTYKELVCQGDVCTSIDYTEEGKKTTRDTCVMNGDVCNVKLSQTYDTNGNQVTNLTCSSNNSDGSCSGYSSGEYYTYDSDNKKTSYLYCSGSKIKSDGSCSGYGSGKYYMYDDQGNQIAVRDCYSSSYINTSTGACSYYKGGYAYKYDSNGNQTSWAQCTSISNEGICSNSSGSGYNYTYDNDGNQTSQRKCSYVRTDGFCRNYDIAYAYDYTYDSHGNRTGSWRCQKINSDGSCNGYVSGYSSVYEYQYDSNGNTLSQRNCSSNNRNTDGSCKSYNGGYDYSYDSNGNKLSEKTCSGMHSDGTCSYSSGTYYTYDSSGNNISERSCNGFNSDGNCNSYSYGRDFLYDEQGNKTGLRVCSSWTATTCNSWNAWTYY